ncbi:MAG: restriction endonuclease subunit S [Burkholderiales bacterium]
MSWPVVRLDECCEIVAGATPSTSEASYWGGDICWATPKDLSDLASPVISDTPRKLTETGLRSCAATLLPVRSVLFSSRAPIGHVAINTVPMATNQGFKSFVPKAGQVVPEFLYWWLRYNRAYLESLGNGATFKEVSKAIVSRVEIALPSLEEQRRIATILDQAETLRTQRRQALTHLDTLTQSLFLDMFGDPASNPMRWDTLKVEQLADQVTDGEHLTPKRELAGIKLLSARNVRDGFIDFQNVDFVGQAEHERIKKRCNPVRGDVLISCSGSIGRVASVETDEPFSLVRSVAMIRPKTDVIYTKFLEYYLRTPAMNAYMIRRANASSQANLFQGPIREMPVMVPPLSLQQIFATRIQAIETLKATHRAALAQLDALFASLQQRAFAGELTARASTALSTPPVKRDFAELGRLDATKGLEALVYAAWRLPGKGHYWATKTMYIADRRHLEGHGRTIYGETHVAMPHGPVPQAAFNASRALERGELICEFPMDAVRAALRREGDQLIALRDADTTLLGAPERESLDWAIRYVQDMNFAQLKMASHDAAWQNTAENAPIPWEDIIRTLSPAAQQRFFG